MWKSQKCSQSSKTDWLLTRGWQDLQWERVIAKGLTLHRLIGGSGSGHWWCLGYCTIPCPLEAGWGMPWRHSASELQSWVSSTEACWLPPLSCTQDWGHLFFFFKLGKLLLEKGLEEIAFHANTSKLTRWELVMRPRGSTVKGCW